MGRIAAREGPEAPTAGIRHWLEGDVVLGNLETAVTTRGLAALKLWTFRTRPAGLGILKRAGFTVLNLANNHVMDYGVQGLQDTLKAAREQGFLVVGAGADREAARRPLFIEKHGLKVGILSLTSTIPEAMWAGRARPGVAFADFDRAAEWIRDAKARCDVLLVSFHGGTERETEPNAIQTAFARLAAAAGADVVLGHHPHMLQPVEFIGDCLVFYSIGNFLFVSPTPGTERTVIVRLLLRRGGVSAELVPLNIDGGRPRPARGGELEAIREVLDRRGALTVRPERIKLISPTN
ncbi:MAG: hypothetical protein A2X36_04640 [Elusimicrobia bacterium GWA2_69_24]|nr:MAG: hypothetical protein A2X36_04640 [Elusimicrobia bacterium GWA2_69_24]